MYVCPCIVYAYRIKPTRYYWMIQCTCNLLNIFRAIICPSSGARDYICVIASYGVQCSKDENIQFVFASVMYVPCFWEIYYCVSLPMRRAECVKCFEGIWCSCWWTAQIISAINPSVVSSWFSSLCENYVHCLNAVKVTSAK